MTQYILDCGTHDNDTTCIMAPYTTPPATVEHYVIAPTWSIPVAAAVVIIALIAATVVRYKAHCEHGETDRMRIRNPPKQCPTCGDKVE